jgi:hypothetical protein
MSKPTLSVPTSFTCRFRLAPPDAPPLWSSTSGGDALLRQELPSLARSDVTLRLLLEMDRKLDRILNHMQRESVAADFPFEGRIRELSHTGMIMESADAPSPGQSMELLLMPDLYPQRFISVMAQVTPAAPDIPRADPANTVRALYYTCFSEEDREAIIAFIFQEDRKRIRQTKSGA